jgi:hypothetical protein
MQNYTSNQRLKLADRFSNMSQQNENRQRGGRITTTIKSALPFILTTSMQTAVCINVENSPNNLQMLNKKKIHDPLLSKRVQTSEIRESSLD